MKRILSALAVVVAFGGAFAVEEKKEEKKVDAAKLVGKWEITKTSEAGGAPKGTIIEFTKDGKVIGTVEIDGTKMDFKGTYKVDGEKLKLEVEVGGMSHSNEDTIKSLTAEKLVLLDKEGNENELTKKK